MFLISRILFFIKHKIERIYHDLFCTYCKKQLKSCGSNFRIHYSSSLLSLHCISVGDNFNTGPRLRLRAYSEYENQRYQPTIFIGNNFYTGVDCAVTAVGNIHIGHNVTLASRVTVIDHSHGKNDYADINTPVMKRTLGVKGDIIIEDNVWLCEGVIVLSNVRIGKNSIIGANSVVTKDIPANSIAAGIPAKVIKIIQ